MTILAGAGTERRSQTARWHFQFRGSRARFVVANGWVAWGALCRQSQPLLLEWGERAPRMVELQTRKQGGFSRVMTNRGDGTRTLRIFTEVKDRRVNAVAVQSTATSTRRSTRTRIKAVNCGKRGAPPTLVAHSDKISEKRGAIESTNPGAIRPGGFTRQKRIRNRGKRVLASQRRRNRARNVRNWWERSDREGRRTPYLHH